MEHNIRRYQSLLLVGCRIAVDTGTHRIDFSPEDVEGIRRCLSGGKLWAKKA